MNKHCKLILVNLFISILLSCTPKSISIENMIKIMHAGGTTTNETYLNAMEPFEYFYNKGFRYFEYDLKLSNDGRLIGTHSWDYLEVESDDISYDEFKGLKLSNGMTPINEEWIIDTLSEYNDVKFVIDSKMDITEKDAEVLIRLDIVCKENNIDVQNRILPEIFSVEMWDLLKDVTSYNQCIFSHYKVNYSVKQILEYFSSSRFIAIGMDFNTSSYFKKAIPKFHKNEKKVFFFTPETYEEVEECASLGADGIYIDNEIILKQN
ncbi:MAG: glycerophosphodiester phosphodiesterase family protein [Bacilli bacterium]